MFRRVTVRSIWVFTSSVGWILNVLVVAAAFAAVFSNNLAELLDVETLALDPWFSAVPLAFWAAVVVYKSVWDEAVAMERSRDRIQNRLNEYEMRLPLRILGPRHEGQFRRFAIENPNAFVVSGAYVEVRSYIALDVLDTQRYPLPGEGFRFGWGTQQANPRGDIGANDTLILDLVEFRNSDHFTHSMPSGELHQYVRDYALPYGNYRIELALGARGTAVPVGTETVTIQFSPGQLLVDCASSALAATESRAFRARPA